MALCLTGHRSTAASDPHWKLTAAEYFFSTFHGTDINLRWRGSDTSAWGGFYTDPVFGTQARAGVDTAIDLGLHLQLQPSLQAASGGFVGGSVNLQAGDTWYALAGIGRTDTRRYFNLNFDPNDAVTIGAGYHGADGFTIGALLVADDRFHTGQRDWHLNSQIPCAASHATLDLLYKTGLSDAGRVAAWGGSVNWDFPRWFVRAAYDPYQNFSAQKVWRVATGVRF